VKEPPTGDDWETAAEIPSAVEGPQIWRKRVGVELEAFTRPIRHFARAKFSGQAKSLSRVPKSRAQPRDLAVWRKRVGVELEAFTRRLSRVPKSRAQPRDLAVWRKRVGVELEAFTRPFGTSLARSSQGRLKAEPRAEIPSAAEGPRRSAEASGSRTHHRHQR